VMQQLANASDQAAAGCPAATLPRSPGAAVVFRSICHPELGCLAGLVATLCDGEDVTMGRASGIAVSPAPCDYDDFEPGQSVYPRDAQL